MNACHVTSAIASRITSSIALVLSVALLAPPSGAAETHSCWPAWDGFAKRFVADSGRVVDPTANTTSEGESYAMFFALVADDRAGFERVLRWTENNLAGGDLTARLPAWRWGKQSANAWGVIDENAASDADMWIAYDLLEAGRLWNDPKFAALGQLLAERILREESVQLPGFGRSLLPGPRGFQPQPGTARLNPSYFPIQILRRMSALFPQSDWKEIEAGAPDLITRSAPKGFAPDWIVYRKDDGFQADKATNAAGGFNAIRVYLWAGMLADGDPAKARLLQIFAPMARHVAEHGTPPLGVDTRNGNATGAGPAGFSAALLPFLAASGRQDLEAQQRLRIEAKSPLERSDNYYEQALGLFGIGWTEGRYRFARDGNLVPTWTCGAR